MSIYFGNKKSPDDIHFKLQGKEEIKNIAYIYTVNKKVFERLVTVNISNPDGIKVRYSTETISPRDITGNATIKVKYGETITFLLGELSTTSTLYTCSFQRDNGSVTGYYPASDLIDDTYFSTFNPIQVKTKVDTFKDISIKVRRVDYWYQLSNVGTVDSAYYRPQILLKMGDSSVNWSINNYKPYWVKAGTAVSGDYTAVNISDNVWIWNAQNLSAWQLSSASVKPFESFTANEPKGILMLQSTLEIWNRLAPFSVYIPNDSQGYNKITPSYSYNGDNLCYTNNTADLSSNRVTTGTISCYPSSSKGRWYIWIRNPVSPKLASMNVDCKITTNFLTITPMLKLTSVSGHISITPTIENNWGSYKYNSTFTHNVNTKLIFNSSEYGLYVKSDSSSRTLAVINTFKPILFLSSPTTIAIKDTSTNDNYCRYGINGNWSGWYDDQKEKTTGYIATGSSSTTITKERYIWTNKTVYVSVSGNDWSRGNNGTVTNNTPVKLEVCLNNVRQGNNENDYTYGTITSDKNGADNACHTINLDPNGNLVSISDRDRGGLGDSYTVIRIRRMYLANGDVYDKWRTCWVQWDNKSVDINVD